MLSTDLRSTQTQDPTGVARFLDAPGCVTTRAYRGCAHLRPSAASAVATRPHTGSTSGWASIGLAAMPKVDFHDRWPLHSTS